MSSTNFPDDLLPDLLSRLPVTALLKFKVVSKSWLSLIEDPKFRSIHTKRACQSTSSITQVFLYEFDSDVKKICEINWSGGIDGVVFLEFCPIPNLEISRFVGSSNGVVCVLCDIDYRTTIILWNPLSRKYQIIPPVPPYPDGGPPDVLFYTYGFGYDKVNDDYKILCLDNRLRSAALVALVYSRKINTWRTIDYGLPIPSYAPGLLYGGSLHWISYNNSSLILLDLAKEEFISLTISVSKLLLDANLFIMRDGRVCMKMWYFHQDYAIRLMVNYDEWIEFRFKPKGDKKLERDVDPPNLIPVAYVESPKPIMMMMEKFEKKLVFYDVEEQSLIFNGRVMTTNGSCDGPVFPYIQTLELYK